MKLKDINTRFWNKVNKHRKNDCWEFLGCKSSNGYGGFQVDGKLKLAHRISYQLTFGEIPKGKLVCHTCDNRMCVNPNHLFIGDYFINNRDCQDKGRHHTLYGENNGRSKLTNQQVLEIVYLYKNGNFTQRKLSRKFGVGVTAICDILNGNKWNQVTGIKSEAM